MAAEVENEAAAIKALGSLFKLTQVYLWDDSFVETPQVLSSTANWDFHPNNATSTSSKLDSTFKGFTRSLEDMELTQQMNALGLPVSFNTSKKGSVTMKAKRKGIKVKPKSGHEVNKDRVVDVSKVKDGEVVPPINFHDKTNVSLCCISTLDRSETSSSDIAEEVYKTHCSSNGGSVIMEEVCEEITGVMESCGADNDIVPCEIMSNGDSEVVVSPIHEDGEISQQNCMHVSSLDKPLLENRSLESSFMTYYDSESEKICVDIKTEEPCIPDSGVSSQSSIVTDHMKDEYDNCIQCEDFGDWRAFWDSFYMRTYFYNIKTHESTWYPPLGFEYTSFSEAEPKPSNMIVHTAEKDIISGVSSVEVLDSCDLPDASHLVEKITSSSNSSVHSSHETSSGVEPDGYGISGLDLATINCNYKHSEELDGLNSFSEIKKNPDGEASSYSVTNTQDDPNSRSQLGSEEDWSYDLQNTFTNSKTDELDAYKQFSKVEVISCGDAQQVCDMSTNTVSDAGRLTITITKDSEENQNDVQLEYMAPAIDDLERQKDPVWSKKKKKVRRTRTQRRLCDNNTELQFDGMPEEFPDGIVKYWCQRYSLFSRFDDGIKMDEEAWFSVTPEPIAVHHASRCGGGIVIDSFTGVGGNAIQLAKRGNHVIAIDIDPQKIEYAQHNASIYGADGNIDFIKGDFFQLALEMKADVVFLSPPWGGPDYSKVHTYNIKTMLKPHDGYFLFNTSRGIASKIVMFLPKNVDINQLAELSLSVHPPWALEVERNFLNGKLKAITAYFSDTAV